MFPNLKEVALYRCPTRTMGHMGSSVVMGLSAVGMLEGGIGHLAARGLLHAKATSIPAGRGGSLGIAWVGQRESSAGTGPLVCGVGLHTTGCLT